MPQDTLGGVAIGVSWVVFSCDVSAIGESWQFSSSSLLSLLSLLDDRCSGLEDDDNEDEVEDEDEDKLLEDSDETDRVLAMIEYLLLRYSKKE